MHFSAPKPHIPPDVLLEGVPAIEMGGNSCTHNRGSVGFCAGINYCNFPSLVLSVNLAASVHNLLLIRSSIFFDFPMRFIVLCSLGSLVRWTLILKSICSIELPCYTWCLRRPTRKAASAKRHQLFVNCFRLFFFRGAVASRGQFLTKTAKSISATQLDYVIL